MEKGIEGRENRMLIIWRKGKVRVIGICKYFGFRGLKDVSRDRVRSVIIEFGWC